MPTTANFEGVGTHSLWEPGHGLIEYITTCVAGPSPSGSVGFSFTGCSVLLRGDREELLIEIRPSFRQFVIVLQDKPYSKKSTYRLYEVDAAGVQVSAAARTGDCELVCEGIACVTDNCTTSR